MIELKNIYKSFDGKQVLKDFSLEVKKGEKICIMGKSGCGKTTVINLLLGLIAPDAGEVKNPYTAAPVFQENRLCENFSSLANVKMVLPDKSKNTAAELLRELELGDDMLRPVNELSGGMKRRVAIARALAADKELLLLDEPFKGLDEATRARVADVINLKAADKTVVLVSHDPDEAELLGARIVTLSYEV